MDTNKIIQPTYHNTKTQKIKHMGSVKECTKCKTQLTIGVNIAPSLWNNATYVCKTCYYNKNKLYNEQYIINNRDKKAKAQEKYISKIPAGVYCVKEHSEIIYIGQSNKPQRRFYGHFAKQGGKEDIISKINNYIHNKGKENFTFEMMVYESDLDKRLIIEKQLQEQYNPLFNVSNTL